MLLDFSDIKPGILTVYPDAVACRMMRMICNALAQVSRGEVVWIRDPENALTSRQKPHDILYGCSLLIAGDEGIADPGALPRIYFAEARRVDVAFGIWRQT